MIRSRMSQDELQDMSNTLHEFPIEKRADRRREKIDWRNEAMAKWSGIR